MGFKRGFVVPIALVGLSAVLLFAAARIQDPRGKPVEGEFVGAALVLKGDALDSPDPSPVQMVMHSPRGMTITVLPNHPPPTPAERGVRILLVPEQVAHVAGRPLLVEIQYDLPTQNPASDLAVSLQGIDPAVWVIRPLQPNESGARFNLPAQDDVAAIGLRAIAKERGAPGEVTITEIRVLPAQNIEN